ncbi:hypothetical protein VIGAN_01156000, partial [Vigna angularis var. angularis]
FKSYHPMLIIFSDQLFDLIDYCLREESLGRTGSDFSIFNFLVSSDASSSALERFLESSTIVLVLESINS